MLAPIERSSIWHPYTSIPALGPRELLVRAKGAYVTDEKGRSYFDATSSWWCILHGHCHPDLVAALTQQAGQLDQVLVAPHSHPVAEQLAESLLERLGTPFSKIFFSDNGSTAVETALKMALQYWQVQGQPQRRDFLSIESGYHGDTLGAISVGHVDAFHRAFATKGSTRKSTVPYCYRCPLQLKQPSCGIACLDQAAKILEEESENLAAVILEPLVLGAAGMIAYPKEYVERLVALCRKKKLLVIFDEVFTGFGRTGSFFAFNQTNAIPDMVCLSKGLTSGMLALGATAATSEIFQAFVGGERKKFFHGHTFTANALACAVALESLRVFEREGTLEKNQLLAQAMTAQSTRFAQLDLVGDVRQQGMIWAMELVADKGSRQPLGGDVLWAIASRAWERGIWVRPLGNVLYVVPPYCSEQQDLAACFEVLYGEVKRQGEMNAG